MEPAQERPRPAPLEDSTVLGLSGRAVMVVDARSPPPSVRGSRSPSRASLSRSAYSLEEKTDTNDVDSSPPQGVRGRIHTTSTTISPVRDDVKQVSLMERRFRETEVEWLRRHTAQSKEIRRLHRELAGTKKAAAEEVAEVRDWQRKAQYAQAYPDKVIRYLQEEMEAARTTNQSLATHISTLELQINVQHNAMLQGFPEVTFKVENYYPPDGSAPIPYYVPQRLDLLSGDFSEEATRRRQPPPQENIPPHFIPLDDHSEEYCDSESVLSEAESEGIHDNGPVPFISTVPPAQMCTKDVSLPAPPPEVAKKEVRTPDAAAILRAQQGHLVDLAARRPEQAGQMLRDEVQICRGGAGGNGVPRLFPHIAVGRIWAKKAAGRPPQMTSPPPQIRMTRNKDRSLAPKIPSVGISGFPGPTIAVPRPPSARNRKPMKGRSLVSARHKPSSEAPMNVQQCLRPPVSRSFCMAFGVSCALPLKRKIMVQRLQPSYQKEEESVPLSELLRPPKMQRTTRHSPERHLPTLATCGLSDSLFYGEQKWPRAKAFNISSQSLSSPYDHDLPDVKLNRPTRHGLSHTQGDVYAKSRRAERDLKDKIQLMRFPVLDLLQPTRVEKRQPVTAPANAKEGRTAKPIRHVALPKSFRSNMFVDATGRRLFSEATVY